MSPVTIGFIDSIDQKAPAGSFSTPGAGASVSGVITVAVNPTDNDQVASVQFKIDGNNIGGPVTSAPWQVSYDTRGQVNGGHTLSAVIRDRVGNQTTITQNVTHANLPVITISSPGSGATIYDTITFAATVTSYGSSCSVQFYVDGNPHGGALGPGYNSYAYDTHYLGVGWHQWKVGATDAQGNHSETYVNAYVGNAIPGAGYLVWGNLMQWWDDADFTGWTSYRSSPPNYDNRWGGSLAEPLGAGSWWDGPGQGAGAYPALYLPGNPDPGHYQMRIQEVHGWVEGGTDHNHVYFAWWLYGNEYIIIVDGNGQGLVLNVNGGEGIQILRWANDPGWNSSMTHDVKVYYDFVLKPGFAS